METITSILKLVTTKTYFTKIDLEDVDCIIPIAAEHQKYLKFSHRSDLHQFICLPNRNCHGIRKFTKSLKPPFFVLRLDGVNMNRSSQECWKNTKQIIQTFQNLGFTVHPEPKSVLQPSQKIEFLGFILNSVNMTITLTDENKRQLNSFCTNNN